MVQSSVKEISELLIEKKNEILLLRSAVEAKYPDLKLEKTSTLKDGTVVDDVFYLKYVLSSRQPLSNKLEVIESKTLQHIDAAIKWRNSDVGVEISSTPVDVEFSKTLPLLKTGELGQGQPVFFLPFKEVDLALINKKKSEESFRDYMLSQILKQKVHLFKELDVKSRKMGKLVKSVSVYDLDGMKFKHVYQMKGFFELLQSQSKKFKQLFPQLTEVTVLVNSPGSFLLKSLLTSSKQKVMTVAAFLKSYNAVEAVPDLIGGTFKWPKTQSDLVAVATGSEVSSLDSLHLEDVDVKTVISQCDAESVAFSPSPQIKKKLNKKTLIDECERQMLRMKKNRLFSINVLQANQTVNVFFSNMRSKNTNLLVEMKLANGEVNKRTVMLPKGFVSLPFNMKTKGEIIFAFVDSKIARKFESGQKSVELLNLHRPAAKKLFRSGKKFGKRRARQMREKTKKKNLKKMDYEAVIEYEEKQRLKELGIAEEDKVFFRFEVTDSVVCGSQDGESVIDEEQIEEIAGLPTSDSVQELVDYDARSLLSLEADEMRSYEQPSFFKTATQILTRGW